MAAVSEMQKRGRPAPTPVDHGEVDTLLRRFAEHSQVQHTPAAFKVASAQPQVPPPRRDFDMASDLLDRASQAFNLLITRCQALEQELDAASASAEAQAAEQESTIEQWKRLASGLKAQAEASESAIAAMTQRCNAAEARSAMAEQRAASLERASAQAAGQAALAESLSTKLHDKVVSAFGIGSRAHPVLEAVATRSAAE